MISMQQLEELESRIIKALQLIGDLRTENSRLESDNESLKVVAEEAKLSLEEKEQELARIQRELDDTARELAELKDKENVLEKKIIELLGKMDALKTGSAPIFERGTRAERPAARESAPKSAPRVAPRREDVSVETVRSGDDIVISDKDDDIIIIDDDTALADADVRVETSPGRPGGEDEIILLDDGADEIVIDDVDSDLVIIDETEKGKSSKKKGRSFDELSMDDDFLIIEEDGK
ncbi:MAG TPA: cell division protein ZapB [Spirochaetota bacterium]|nr:cell division protein ZapB [Spirochaetota bacterium]